MRFHAEAAGGTIPRMPAPPDVYAPTLSTRQLRFYRVVFAAAAVYNLVWGTLIVLFPRQPFLWAGMEAPNYPELWQCIGMMVAVYAVGYAYVAADPLRYAPLALVGLLGKIFGPVGWVWAWSNGRLPAVSGLTILTNDVGWWPFFIPFVWQTVVRRRRNRAGGSPSER